MTQSMELRRNCLSRMASSVVPGTVETPIVCFISKKLGWMKKMEVSGEGEGMECLAGQWLTTTAEHDNNTTSALAK